MNEIQKIRLRPSHERGHFDHGWLNSFHTFSFADYYDPNFMNFRALRVINEDWVKPGEGFPKHPHRDMEIITYVIEGSLAHKDSMGNGSTIFPGELQRMSAGRGVHHSEYNASDHEILHLLQIWVMTDQKGREPEYEQKKFDPVEKRGVLRLVVSPNGQAGSLKVHQDMRLYSSLLSPGQAIEDRLEKDRYGWIQMIHGCVSVNGMLLSPGDGAALPQGSTLDLRSPISGTQEAEFLLFDLA